MDVEEPRGRIACVVERVDDIGRDEHERPSRRPERTAPERDLQLALDDEERVGVVVVDVRACAALARPVVELGQRQVLGVREQRHAAAGAVGDRLPVNAARADDRDRRGTGSIVGRRRVLVERRAGLRRSVLVRGGRELAQEHAVPGRRGMDVEEPRPALRRNVCTIPGGTTPRCPRRRPAPRSRQETGARPRARGRPQCAPHGRAAAVSGRRLRKRAAETPRLVMVRQQLDRVASRQGRRASRPGRMLGATGKRGVMGYVELHCHSAFSFLDGASHPEELVARGGVHGYPALALTDHRHGQPTARWSSRTRRNSLGVRPITGAEVTLEEVGRGTIHTSSCESEKPGGTRISAGSSPLLMPARAVPAGLTASPCRRRFRSRSSRS